MRKYGIKKFWKNSEKILRTLYEENKQFFFYSFSVKLIVFEKKIIKDIDQYSAIFSN